MSILSFLSGSSRRGIPVAVPTQPIVSAIPPQENYDKVYGHPPMSLFTGGYIPDPFRKHAPFPIERGRDRFVTNTGIHNFVYEPGLQRVPDSALQQQFNQKMILPTVDVGVPAHGVFVQQTQRDCVEHAKYGGNVPQDTRGEVTPSHSPVVLLSTPINVTTNTMANGNPELQASNHGSPPLNIVKGKDRMVPRVIGYGK